MKLIYCTHQNYNWGKKGSCLVSNFINSNNGEKFSVNDHYAEVWISMHKKLPSYFDKNKTEILDIIKIREKLNIDTPTILTKLISVEKPLSIQIHPDKKNAVELHNSQPILYQDDNSKNELLVALSDFRLMCGYNNLTNIKKNIESHPILKSIWKNIDTSSIGDLYHNLMDINQPNAIELVNKHYQYCKSLSTPSIEDIFFMLIAKYYINNLADISSFLVYLMNCIELKPFEGLYIESLIPHCYVSGDGIEIMDSSDNVVRCGLTSKYVNVNLFQQLMNTDQYLIKILKPMPNKLINYYCQSCNTNFQLSKIELKIGDKFQYLIKNYGFIIIINGTLLLSNSENILKVTYGNVVLVIKDTITLKIPDDIELEQSNIAFIAESI